MRPFRLSRVTKRTSQSPEGSSHCPGNIAPVDSKFLAVPGSSLPFISFENCPAIFPWEVTAIAANPSFPLPCLSTFDKLEIESSHSKHCTSLFSNRNKIPLSSRRPPRQAVSLFFSAFPSQRRNPLALQSVLQRSHILCFAQLREQPGPQRGYHDRPDASQQHRRHGSEPLRRRPGLKLPQLVRRPDENHVHRIYPPAHFVRRA